MNVLIVEDEVERIEAFKKNNPGHDITWTLDPAEAISLLGTQKFDIICLDHDLGYEPGTNKELNTMPMVEYLRIEWGDSWNDNTFIILHSINRPARDHMLLTLQRVQCQALAIPFAWTKQNLFDCLKGTHEHL